MTAEKNKILESLKNTYCRLKPSQISGIGVFAVRDIPQDANPFFGARQQNWHSFEFSELNGIDEEVLKMANDFFAVNEAGQIEIPECGLNGIDISFFLNWSENPNIKTEDGENFLTIKEIKKGEELTISYANYDKRYR